MIKGPSLGHNSSMRKQAPKNSTNIVTMDDQKRANYKYEPG